MQSIDLKIQIVIENLFSIKRHGSVSGQLQNWHYFPYPGLTNVVFDYLKKRGNAGQILVQHENLDCQFETDQYFKKKQDYWSIDCWDIKY